MRGRASSSYTKKGFRSSSGISNSIWMPVLLSSGGITMDQVSPSSRTSRPSSIFVAQRNVPPKGNYEAVPILRRPYSPVRTHPLRHELEAEIDQLHTRDHRTFRRARKVV